MHRLASQPDRRAGEEANAPLADHFRLVARQVDHRRGFQAAKATIDDQIDMVFEHPGESTFPVSCFVVKRGGMVVFCAGTTGYNLTMDARFVWMRQKRIQGSHFANLLQASQANQLVIERRIDPCMSEVFEWADIPKAHTKMWKNQHKPGNMAVLVQAPRPGLKTFEDTLEASRASRACERPSASRRACTS